MPQPLLLITGATGFVGGELLESLLAVKPSRRIAALARRPAMLSGKFIGANLEVFQGDLTRPDLGLDHSQIQKLQSSVTEVIHCAAETHFNLSLEQARATNVVGTENLLSLARRCTRLEKFAYISTVYVAGRTTGRIAERALAHRPIFSNSYQQSKFEAEELVLRSRDEAPAAIFRLSSILGDSETGHVRQFNYVHHLLRLFPRNVLPVIPGDPDAPIDVIPTDWAVSALRYLFDEGFVRGRIYHVCAGARNSLTLSETMELTRRLFEGHGNARKWLPIRVPKLVSLGEYQQFVKQRRQAGDRLLDELLRALDFFLPQMAFYQQFETNHTASALAGCGLRFPPIRDAYAKVVRYCLDTDWGAQHPPTC